MEKLLKNIGYIAGTVLLLASWHTLGGLSGTKMFFRIRTNLRVISGLTMKWIYSLSACILMALRTSFSRRRIDGAAYLRLVAAFVLLICHATPMQSQNLGAPGSSSRIASFDWTMPDRLLDENNDGRIDTAFFPLAEQRPDTLAGFHVDFNASASTQPVSVYQWYVGTADVIEVSEYDGFSYNFPAEGTYPVTLTTIDPKGVKTSVTKQVIVQDWLILALGDSYASGEGNPDVPIDLAALNTALGVLADERDEYNSALEEFNVAQDKYDGAFQDLQVKEDVLRLIVAQANLVRARLNDVNTAQAALNTAISIQNDACGNFPPTPVLCAQATAQVLTARGALTSVQAALLVELVTMGLETLIDQLSQIEAALLTLIQAPQDAVDEARKLRDLALAALNLANELKDLALAAWNAAQEAYDLDLEMLGNKAEWNQDGNRSMYSGFTRAALMVEKADPRTSVTLFHGARSGAEIKGIIEIGGQQQKAKEAIGNREVDAILISIGGNDVSFANVLMICMQEEPCFDPVVGPARDDMIDAICGQLVDFPISARFIDLIGEQHPWTRCKEYLEGLDTGSDLGTNAQDIFLDSLKQLPAKYDSLQAKIDSNMWLQERVYITKYPNALRNDQGDLCAWDWNVAPGEQLNQLPGISLVEMIAAEGWLKQLNDKILSASIKNQWNLVDFLDEDKNDEFETHGYCADENWIVRIDESFMTQGDHNGVAHPSAEGHEVYARHVFAALMEDFFDEQGFARPPREVPPTSVEELGEAVPETFALSQNYPNPFNPATTISYSLSKESHVKLTIFNILGREVSVLVDDVMPAGNHDVRVEANQLPSGLYFYRIAAGAFQETRRMLLLK